MDLNRAKASFSVLSLSSLLAMVLEAKTSSLALEQTASSAEYSEGHRLRNLAEMASVVALSSKYSATRRAINPVATYTHG